MIALIKNVDVSFIMNNCIIKNISSLELFAANSIKKATFLRFHNMAIVSHSSIN